MNWPKTPLNCFASEYGILVSEAEAFRATAIDRARMLEHEMNGDPHPHSQIRADKNENARRWGEDAAKLGKQMTALAQRWGFDHVDYGVGLYPTLQKTESDTAGTVHFPYD